MKYIKFSLIAVVSLLLASTIITQTAKADCDVVGSTPGGGEDIVCTGVETGGLDTSDFPDLITIQPGANITGPNFSVVDTNNGDDTVNMNGGTINAADICLSTSNGDDNINITNGNLVCGFDCINASSDNDIINLNGASLNCGGPSGINAASDNDIITVDNTQITSNINAINAASGDDQITIGNNVLLTSGGPNINCSSGFDTLTFAMAVSEGLVAPLTELLATLDPMSGDITINGFFYQWTSCEVLVADFQDPERPIPTLSEWGLIAMAVILGVVGVIVARRRFQTV